MTPALFTFGYEGSTIDEFIARLRGAQIDIIVDVRELPLSRKKGFSKNSFRDCLAKAGIDYQHLAALGCPKPVRDRYRLDGDWNAYTQSFLAHLASVKSQVRELALRSRARRACLVCFEADFRACHRTYVARAIRHAGGPAVHHLTLKTVVADAQESLAA